MEKYRNISEFVIGFSLLFLGLSLMKNSVPDLQETPEVLAFIKQWTGYGFGSVLIFLIFGTVLTLVLQSSSATMALTLIMLSMGWLPFEMAAAMVLGENIGTTITANVAAAIGNPNARRAALAHTIFNLLGVIWALALFRPFLSLVGILITWLGYPNPTELVYTGTLNPASDESTAALYGVSMLHTLFNVINAVLLIGFIPQLTRLVTAVIKDKPKDEDDKTQLKYINAGNVATAEIAIAQAQKEVVHFAQISRNGLDYVRSALNATTEDERLLMGQGFQTDGTSGIPDGGNQGKQHYLPHTLIRGSQRALHRKCRQHNNSEVFFCLKREEHTPAGFPWMVQPADIP